MKTFVRLMLLTWLLNVYDTVITLYGTQELEAVEANPLMRIAIEFDPLVFIAVKIAVLTVVLMILYTRFEKHRKRTKVTLWIIFALYLMICVWNTIIVTWLVW